MNQPEPNRFFVHFSASARTEGTAPAFVNIYSVHNEVNVQFSDAATSKGSITVVNMQVASLKLDVPEGVYIVKVSSESGMTAKKVLITSK